MPSTGLQQASAILQQGNYTSLAIATAIGYDYVLTLPSEIEYVWNQPWSLVSFLFILVRYLGCYSAMAPSLYGIIVAPKYHRAIGVYNAFYVVNQFTFLFFIAAADMVMILRVWAMYSRSKLILVVLLMIFVAYIVFSTVVTVIADIPGNVAETTTQTLGFSFCSDSPALYVWKENTVVLQLIPAAVMCVLVVAQFVRQSIQMYRATKDWRLNQYMNLLCRESILYFVVTLIFGLANLPMQCLFDTPTTKGLSATFFVACNVPLFSLTPRFILSTRALYTRNLRERRSCGIDTGFGFSSPFNPGVGGTAMVFADVERNEESERDEEMQIEGSLSPASEWQQQ